LSKLWFKWRLEGSGWASCVVADEVGEAEVVASYVTDGPEQFLRAVANVTYDDRPTRAEFEAEPLVFRWYFERDDKTVTIRLVETRETGAPDNSGRTIWSGRHAADVLLRAVVRAFDAVLNDLGDAEYEAQWGRPFPHSEVEAVRAAYRRQRRLGPHLH
jgi:hypothetical protein